MSNRSTAVPAVATRSVRSLLNRVCDLLVWDAGLRDASDRKKAGRVAALHDEARRVIDALQCSASICSQLGITADEMRVARIVGWLSRAAESLAVVADDLKPQHAPAAGEDPHVLAKRARKHLAASAACLTSALRDLRALVAAERAVARRTAQ